MSNFLHGRDSAPRSVMPSGYNGRFVMRAAGMVAALAGLKSGISENPAIKQTLDELHRTTSRINYRGL